MLDALPTVAQAGGRALDAVGLKRGGDLDPVGAVLRDQRLHQLILLHTERDAVGSVRVGGGNGRVGGGRH
eukprot:2193117-Prymnesium_polylepis.1